MPGQLAFPAPYAYRSPFKKADGSYDWETELEFGLSMIDRQSVGSLAAFIMEPILSTGGILEPPKGYLKRMSEECKKRGMLLILDEAQTGVGRTGKMFAYEHEEEFIPDILALSKTLGCGLPLASVTTTAEIERGCKEAGFLWLTTHLNDPLTAAVGSEGSRDSQARQRMPKGYRTWSAATCWSRKTPAKVLVYWRYPW